MGGAIYSVHASILHSSSVAALIDKNSEVTIRAKVTSEPKRTSNRVQGSRLHKSKISFLARTSFVESGSDTSEVRVPIRILTTELESPSLGEEIEVIGALIRTSEKRVAGTLIVSKRIKTLAKPGSLAQLLTEIRGKFREKLAKFDDDAGSLIPGMIIGDTSLQTPEFSEDMRRAGLSHLTAVSGANFAIVSSLVFFLSRRVATKIMPRLLVTSAFLLLFLLLVRPSPSVLRAGVMAGVVLVARASGNARNSVSALGAAISLLVLLDPFQALDPGFILSVLATSGLLFIAPVLTGKLKRFLPESVAETFAVPCAATLACTPYLLLLAGEISTLSVVFNVLVSPLVAPLTILGFLSLITMPIALLSDALIWPAHLCAQWLTTVASWSDLSPSLAVNFWALLLFSALLILVIARGLHKTLVIVGLAGIALLISPRLSFPGSDWKIVQCDVGQGDALVLNLGDGDGVLFDAGPDPQALARCLRNIGVKRLPLVVISHGHADHYFGGRALSKKYEIGEVWSNSNTSIAQFLDHEIRIARKGMKASIKDISIEILWPDDYDQEFQSLGGDGSPENNRSVVALVSLPDRKLLITGDIEPEVQAILRRDFDLSSVDILKVPHHGSRFQDEAFLTEISPEIALVSVGEGNSYGHPNPELLSSLARDGARVLRTDHDGPISVAWRFDDSAGRYIFTTRAMRKEWWRVQWR